MLHVHLLGSVQIHLDSEGLPPFPTRRSQHLFAFLLLHPHRPWPRTVLADLLWPERPEGQARRRLRNEIWRLRRTVEKPSRRPLLEARRDALRLVGTDCIWCDAHELERATAELEPGNGALPPTTAAPLARAVDLYGGDLLEGCEDEWCRPHRERLRQAWLFALERLMDHHSARGEAARAVGYGSRLLAAEPLHESAHQKLLRCYWDAGDRARAVRAYSEFCRLLSDELGIEPAAETRELLHRIRSGSPAARSSPGSRPAPVSDPLLNRLHDTERELQQALAQVRRALRVLRV